MNVFFYTFRSLAARLAFGIGAFLAAACSSPDHVPDVRGPDLTALLDAEVQGLYRDSVTVARTTMINEQRSQHVLRWVDWKKELAVFYQSDISSPSVAARYRCDTISNNDTMIVTFAADDASLRTRLIELHYLNGTLQKIHIQNASSGWLATQEEELNYLPGAGYSMRSVTRNRFFGEQVLAVAGAFQYSDHRR
ncbi:MAG: hypothetical protein RMK52_02000 [Chitinophagales bacterium]|nr:hypothetical protein [Chitinophagales bacterium]MDW8392998.1 hypothetical protein [Chitinophagales bacterium]